MTNEIRDLIWDNNKWCDEETNTIIDVIIIDEVDFLIGGEGVHPSTSPVQMPETAVTSGQEIINEFHGVDHEGESGGSRIRRKRKRRIRGRSHSRSRRRQWQYSKRKCSRRRKKIRKLIM